MMIESAESLPLIKIRKRVGKIDKEILETIKDITNLRNSLVHHTRKEIKYRNHDIITDKRLIRYVVKDTLEVLGHLLISPKTRKESRLKALALGFTPLNT